MTQAERDQYAWLEGLGSRAASLFTLGSPPFTVDIVFHDVAGQYHARPQGNCTARAGEC